jgi:hypothetical protein
MIILLKKEYKTTLVQNIIISTFYSNSNFKVSKTVDDVIHHLTAHNYKGDRRHSPEMKDWAFWAECPNPWQ